MRVQQIWKMNLQQCIVSWESTGKIYRRGPQLLGVNAFGRPGRQITSEEISYVHTIINQLRLLTKTMLNLGKELLKLISKVVNWMKMQKIEKSYLVPRMRLYLWELKFCIVWIHALYLLSGWCSQNLKLKNHKLIFRMLRCIYWRFNCR